MSEHRAVGTGYVFPPDAERAATLLLILGPDEAPAVVVTERSRHLPLHPGDISLPGGRVHENESPAEAALRETSEELGIPTDEVEIVGVLGDFRARGSRYRIIAHVGRLEELPQLAPNPGEVERAILVPLEMVLELSRYSEIPSPRATDSTTVLFESPVVKVIGATARMLLAFAQRWQEGEYRATLGAPPLPAVHPYLPRQR